MELQVRDGHKFCERMSGYLKRSATWITTTAWFALVQGCGGSSLTTPCAEILLTKPLEIRRIYDVQSGLNVASAVLSDFSRDGGRVMSPFVYAGPGVEVISATQARCFTPCKLGTGAGVYRFTVTAEGFEAKQVEVAADWINKTPAKRETGCDYILSGETVTEIALQKST